jgi:hypothetical protein
LLRGWSSYRPRRRESSRSSTIAIDFDADFADAKHVIRRAALIRTARRIFDGHVHVPESVWSGHRLARADATHARTPARAV